jgi:predicted DNA-binding ribbon-helix-helix protein
LIRSEAPFQDFLENMKSDRCILTDEVKNVNFAQHDHREKANLASFMPVPCLVQIILGFSHAETQDHAINDLELWCRALQHRWRCTMRTRSYCKT